MVHAKRTISMKIATTLCLVLLVLAIRSTGALQSAVTDQNPGIALQEDTTSTGTQRGQLSQESSSDVQGNPTQTSDGAGTTNTTASPSGVTTDTTTTSEGQNSSSSNNSGGSTGSDSTNPGTTDDEITPPSTPITYSFRNGTYFAIGSYSTPGGTQSINVTLVVSDDTIVDSSVTGTAASQPSKNYQQDFIAHYKPFVIGKKIDELSLSKVSSSSLTPIGFNDATDDIESQARI